MKRLLVATAVLFSGCAQESFRIEAPATDAWTSLPLVIEDGLPRVEVVVNGHVEWLLLDTGADATVWLDREAARAVDARFTGLSSMNDDAYGHTWRSWNYILDEVRLGGFSLRDLDGREYPSRGAATGGLLGWRILREFRVLIDYPGETLVLGRNGAFPDLPTDSWTRIPFRATRCGIVTDAVLDGRPVELLWDTGASRMVLKDGRFPKTGDEKTGFRYGAKSLQIGGREFGPFEFFVLDLKDPPGDGLVGHDLFQKHRVLIDWESSTLLVD